MNAERALTGIAAALTAEGLRPVIDAELQLIRADCPDCRAGEADPLGLYRPLTIVPRGDRTRFLCDACGGARDV